MRALSKRRAISFILLVILLLGSSLLAGCGKMNETNSKANNQSNNSELSGTLNLAGSTSVQPFSEVLAEEFMNIHRNVQVNVQGGGSSQGVTAIISGAADIGAASRDLKDEEISQGVTPIMIAIDGIAVVVHPANPVTAMTTDQVKNIYLGKIKNWKEIGGADAPITIVTREEASGTRDAFLDIIMKKENIIASAIVQNSTGAVRTTVAGDKNAIGYISLAKVNQEVKALDIDGAAANEANVKNGTYKLQRPFNYIIKGEPTGLAKAFIEYTLSAEGQKIIEEEGAFKVN